MGADQPAQAAGALVGPEAGGWAEGCGQEPRPLTQAKPVGLVREDQAEPAGLFALKGFAEGQQHLVLQKSTPEQHFLLKGGLGQVLGGVRGARDARLLEGAFSPPPPPQPHHQHFHLHHLPQVDPDEEAGPTAHEGDTQGPEVLRDIGVGSLEPGVVFRQIHLVDPVCVGETEARRSTSHQPSSVSRAPEH